MGNSDSNGKVETNKTVMRMRFRDLRNGVEKVMVTLSGVFTTLSTLWDAMMETNKWAGKVDADVSVDLTATALKVNDMSLTKAQRKAKVAKAADLQKQIDDLVAQRNAL